MEKLRQVDGVEIVTVMDNYTDVFLPGNDEVKRWPLWTDGQISQPLLAEHGLCFLLTIHEGDKKRMILVDSGFTAMGCIYNLDVMKRSLEQVEAFVLSHGHFDHIGSILKFYEKGYLRNGTPLFLHAAAFAERGITTPKGESISMPQLSKERLLEQGAEIVIENGPSLIGDGSCLLTGEVPRLSFEIGFPIGWRKEDTGVIRDDIPDDQSLVFHVKNKGLVVVLGCGHSGVINTLNYAMELTGCSEIYLVIGGFHLTGKIFEKFADQTIDALIGMKPKMVVPAHCTGFNSTRRIAERMPESFVMNSVGTTYSILS
jgi:7,8-dihydropterin-6-yl-methyl-4-(beta-D-ribofuranosyl)aminobenzene 5'-phosphate synthase